MSTLAYWLAGLVVLLQTLFGALEIFAPRFVFDRVFPSYYDTRTDRIWSETEKLARNMGLYNWFLALGLLLSLCGTVGGRAAVEFFLACVTVAGVFGLLSVGWSRAFLLQLIPAGVALLLVCSG